MVPLLGRASDGDLVNLAKQGHVQAFEELMARYRDLGMATAIAVLRDHSDAEDEMQNAWWKVYLHIRQFDQSALFSTWLTRIILNQCLMRLRSKRRAIFLPLDAGFDSEGPHKELADGRPYPEAAALRAQTQHAVQFALRRLPAGMREILTLCDVEGSQMAEAARNLGISLAAAKSRRRRAREELRKRLVRFGERAEWAS
jgi:RNA polymerase sigma-70 factor, ECF subfamily